MEIEANSSFSEKARTDLVLVAQAQNGNQKAFAELLKRYRESVYYMILKMVRNKDDAEDLTIEAFGKAFKNIHSYLPNNAFSTWLFKIASNNTIDFLRCNKIAKKSIPLENVVVDNGDDVSYNNGSFIASLRNPEEKMVKEQRETIMRNIVHQLHHDYRQIIELRYFEEKSYQEIADELNIPLGTVKARLFRSRELLLGIIKNTEFSSKFEN